MNFYVVSCTIPVAIVTLLFLLIGMPNNKTKDREYKPFYEIKDLYPRYLFILDFTFQKNVNGIHNVNIIDFIYNNEDLI